MPIRDTVAILMLILMLLFASLLTDELSNRIENNLYKSSDKITSTYNFDNLNKNPKIQKFIIEK